MLINHSFFWYYIAYNYTHLHDLVIALPQKIIIINFMQLTTFKKKYNYIARKKSLL